MVSQFVLELGQFDRFIPPINGLGRDPSSSLSGCDAAPGEGRAFQHALDLQSLFFWMAGGDVGAIFSNGDYGLISKEVVCNLVWAVLFMVIEWA